MVVGSMRHVVSHAELFGDPCLPGRWWVSLPKDGNAAREWVDRLASAAQLKCPGRVAVLDADAVMVSNLRVWENLVLPLWYREGGALEGFEGRLSNLLVATGLSEDRQTILMGLQPAALDRGERRLMVLLRSLLLEPSCVIVEEEFWRDMLGRGEETAHGRAWRALLAAECMIVAGGCEVPGGWGLVAEREEE